MPERMKWHRRGKKDAAPYGSVVEIASYAAKLFEHKRRDSGEEFWTIRDTAPQWVTDMVHAAHGDMMPDDYKYEFVVRSLWWIEEGNDLDSPEFDPSSSYVGLAHWLGSNAERFGYVDEAVRDLGHRETIDQDIHMGMLKEMEEVYWSVLGTLRGYAERSEE